MEDSRVSRRRVLAGVGTGLSAAIAGCSLGAPDSEREADGSTGSTGAFPEEFSTPAEDPDEPVADSPLAEVYEDIVDSVVAVRLEDVTGATGEAGGGTAWVYDEDHLVTNEHVVRNTDAPFVWFDDNGWREAEVVASDVYTDLAVIEVVDGRPDSATGLPLVENPVAVGTEVAVIGQPFGLTSSFTTGVVSGRNRNIDLPGLEYAIADGIQTDAPVNPGNSGGPIVTKDREVAGVVNSGIAGGPSTPANSVGFGISARITRRVVPELIDDGEFEHSRMGVFLTNVTPNIIEANDLNVTYGVYIDDTVESEAASDVLVGSSGTVEVPRGEESIPTPVGGDVIVGMENDGVSWPIRSIERLSAFLALYTDPGDTIEVELERDGERRTVDLELGRREGSEL